MLYVDPEVCIDCGACADVCPVDAIVADYDLAVKDRAYIEINNEYFEQPGARGYSAKRALRQRPAVTSDVLRVAIVGTGPAACYAAQELLTMAAEGLRIDMFERLLVPGGLVRFGVAPDHLKTKEVANGFERIFDDKRLKLHLGVDVGRDLLHADMIAGYDAVIYAVGMLSSRSLGIKGEDLRGSHSAAEFAAWYNGHPDFADFSCDLDAERAIVIGNGNVALDVARVLMQNVGDLHRSDIAEHALAALKQSRLQEVVVLGRRGPLDAAFTLPELLGLREREDFALWTDLPLGIEDDPLQQEVTALAPWAARQKLRAILDLPRQQPAGRSIRLSFLRSPEAVIGEHRVEGVMQTRNALTRNRDGKIIVAPTGHNLTEEAGLILRSVGFRGDAIAGVPFDETRGTIPNDGGRVRDPTTGDTLRGVYVTGWIKRGPSGVIGTNKSCAHETVNALLADHSAERLGGSTSQDQSDRQSMTLPRHYELADWRAIDQHERASGRAVGRPRVKLVREAEMLRAANAVWSSSDG